MYFLFLHSKKPHQNILWFVKTLFSYVEDSITSDLVTVFRQSNGGLLAEAWDLLDLNKYLWGIHTPEWNICGLAFCSYFCSVFVRFMSLGHYASRQFVCGGVCVCVCVCVCLCFFFLHWANSSLVCYHATSDICIHEVRHSYWLFCNDSS